MLNKFPYCKQLKNSSNHFSTFIYSIFKNLHSCTKSFRDRSSPFSSLLRVVTPGPIVSQIHKPASIHISLVPNRSRAHGYNCPVAAAVLPNSHVQNHDGFKRLLSWYSIVVDWRTASSLARLLSALIHACAQHVCWEPCVLIRTWVSWVWYRSIHRSWSSILTLICDIDLFHDRYTSALVDFFQIFEYEVEYKVQIVPIDFFDRSRPFLHGLIILICILTIVLSVKHY